MSTFLDNLSARALDRAETVRPRLSGLFEPPEGSSPLSVAMLLADEQSEVVPAPRETKPEYLSSLLSAATQSLEQRAAIQPVLAAPIAVPAAPSPGPSGERQHTTRTVEAVRQPSIRPHETAPAVEVVRQPSAGSHVETLPTGTAPVTPPHRVELPPAEQPTLREARPALAPPAPAPPPVSPVVAVNREAVRPTPVEPVIVPVQVRTAAASPTTAGEAAATPPTPTPLPTIRVTIGRVEVRANLPPTPRPIPARPRVAISLEDYLQQQAERRR
jgi:hypothetical protein